MHLNKSYNAFYIKDLSKVLPNNLHFYEKKICITFVYLIKHN